MLFAQRQSGVLNLKFRCGFQRLQLHPPQRLALRKLLHTRDHSVFSSHPEASVYMPSDVGLDIKDTLMLGAPHVLSKEERLKLDEKEDSEFYSSARFTHHSDQLFRTNLTELYGRWLTDGVAILDLCSSWESHLPPQLEPCRVVGHGMNDAELRANKSLTVHFVQDLNQHPRLGTPSRSFDAVLCSNGVQYLQCLEEVAAEVCRVLRPGGCWIISFSDRCYPEKAIAGWLQRSMEQRAQLLQRVLEAVGFRDISIMALPAQAGGDAFCAVVGIAPEQAPAIDASTWLVPALAEMDLMSHVSVSGDTLERWHFAYKALAQDAREMGIPAAAIPQLPPGANVQQLRSCHERLQAMISSFLSAGL